MFEAFPSGFFLLFASLAGAKITQKPMIGDFSTPFNTKFDAFVEDTLNHFHVPGLSIAVVDGNQTFAKVLISSYFTRLHVANSIVSFISSNLYFRDMAMHRFQTFQRPRRLFTMVLQLQSRSRPLPSHSLSTILSMLPPL